MFVELVYHCFTDMHLRSLQPLYRGACLNYLNCFPDNLLSMFSRYPNRINQVTPKRDTPFYTTEGRRKNGRIENIRTKQAGHAFACGKKKIISKALLTVKKPPDHLTAQSSPVLSHSDRTHGGQDLP